MATVVERKIPISKIARMCVVEGNGRTANQVQEQLGCNIAVNASFYGSYRDYDNGPIYYKPVFHLKTEGQVIADPGWKCYGMSWNTLELQKGKASDIGLTMNLVANTTHDNWISGYEMLSPNYGPSASVDKNIPSRTTRRGRTIIGYDLEGYFHIVCLADGTSGAMTATQVRNRCNALGMTNAVMLDGGGSSQYAEDGEFLIRSTRKVCNFLCIWLKPDEPEKPTTKILYRVQIGAYSVKANAERMKAQMKEAGYDCFIAQTTVNGQLLYRVQLGAFGVYANAVKLRDELLGRGWSAFIQKVEVPA